MPKKLKTPERKNTNGEGSVWFDSSRAVFKWSLTTGYDHNGKRQSVGGRAATRQEADMALTNARADQSRGVLTLGDKVTLEDYAANFIAGERHLRGRSVKLFSNEIGYALRVKIGTRALGGMRVSEIRNTHLRAVVTALSSLDMKGPRGQPIKGRRMSPRTLAKVIMRLRQVFKAAVQEQIIYVSPAESLKAGKVSSGEAFESVATVLDFAQLARFQELGHTLHEVGLCRMWPALFTVVSLGLRKGEVMGLKWSDLNLERQMLCIRRARTTDDGQVIETGTKTFKSRRDVPVPQSLVTLLTAHRTRQQLERARAEDAWMDTGAIFATLAGNWVHPSHLSSALEDVLSLSDPNPNAPFWQRRRKLGAAHLERLEAVITVGEKLPRLRVHDLRHTYATLALRSGVPVEVVSKNLGHSKISTTLDIYRHVLESEQKQHTLDLFTAPIPERITQPRAFN